MGSFWCLSRGRMTRLRKCMPQAMWQPPRHRAQPQRTACALISNLDDRIRGIARTSASIISASAPHGRGALRSPRAADSLAAQSGAAPERQPTGCDCGLLHWVGGTPRPVVSHHHLYWRPVWRSASSTSRATPRALPRRSDCVWPPPRWHLPCPPPRPPPRPPWLQLPWACSLQRPPHTSWGRDLAPTTHPTTTRPTTMPPLREGSGCCWGHRRLLSRWRPRRSQRWGQPFGQRRASSGPEGGHGHGGDSRCTRSRARKGVHRSR